MTKINNAAYQAAAKIVSRLDETDGKDCYISKDVWQYAVDKYGAKKVDKCISIFNAQKSLAVYINREIKKNGGNAEDIAEKWYNDLVQFQEKGSKSKSENYSKFEKIEKPKQSEFVMQLSEKNADLNRKFDYKKFITGKLVTKDEVTNLMKDEIKRRGLSEEAADTVDFDYWSEKVCNVANQYKVQPALLIAIMAQETLGRFDKNIDAPAGRGIMGITSIVIKDYFLGDRLGEWYDTIYELDSELLTDILYKKGKNGKLKKDANGQPILKFKTPEDIQKACIRDEELCLKVGLLAYKLNYAKEAAKYINGIPVTESVNEDKVVDVMRKIRGGELSFTEEQNKTIMERAARNYNGCKMLYSRRSKYAGRMVKDVYREQVIDSLKHNRYNFADKHLITRKNNKA